MKGIAVGVVLSIPIWLALYAIAKLAGIAQ